MENLGGWQVLMNNKAIFDSLSFVEQNIFNFLNELVLRIGDDQLNIVGLENIIVLRSAAFIFNIDGISLSRLFAAIGIHVPTNYYKISSSSSK